MSVHRDEDRPGYWSVRWREEGRLRRKRGFRSEAAARDFEALRRSSTRRGAFGETEPSGIMLQTWLTDWWERYSPGWRRSTQLERSAILNTWITPYLGRVRLKDLGEQRIRAWRAQIIRDGASNNRANATMRVLSTAITAAVRERLIPTNPIIGEHRIPKLPHRTQTPRVLTPNEVEAIRHTLTHRRDQLIVAIIAYAGLRPEELIALQISDVSTVAFTIDKAYSAGELGQTKTGGRRVVPIIPPLRADLDDWLTHYQHDTGQDPAADALLIPSERPGVGKEYLNWGWWRDRVWKPARRAARTPDGRPLTHCRPYDLRHTYASLLIHEGRPVNQVAAWMGHSQATTTLKHYAHLFDEAQLGAAQPMTTAITTAREHHTQKNRSRNVPDTTDPQPPPNARQPSNDGKSGRRGSNPRPQAWETPPNSTTPAHIGPQHQQETGPEHPATETRSERPHHTPNVPEVCPERPGHRSHPTGSVEHAADGSRNPSAGPAGQPKQLAGRGASTPTGEHAPPPDTPGSAPGVSGPHLDMATVGWMIADLLDCTHSEAWQRMDEWLAAHSYDEDGGAV